MENTEQSAEKKKKKHREEHSIDKTEPSNNDSEVHIIQTNDEERTDKKKHKKDSTINKEIIHGKEDKTSESHEENTSNKEHNNLVRKNENFESQHTRTEKSPTTLQGITEHVIHKITIPNKSTLANGEGSKKNRTKRKSNGFTVEIVNNQKPSKVGENKNLKRKLDTNSHRVPYKKKKTKTIDKKIKDFSQLKQKRLKNKQENDTSDNPLSKLSDERLKAYGLNPKKYRSFLKYKKF